VATTGIGVHESLKGITKLVIRSLQERHEAEGDAEDRAEQAVEAMSSQVTPKEQVAVESVAPAMPVETVEPMVEPVAASVAAEPMAPVSALPGLGATMEMPEEPAPVSMDAGFEDMPAAAAPPSAAAAPIIEGLLRRAESPEAEEEGATVDLAAELSDEAEEFQASPGVTESPAEGVIPAGAQPVPGVALQDDDPLGLGSDIMEPTPQQTPQVSLPVVLQPGQEEVHIPLEVRAGEKVQRYRLRLHISLGPED